MCKYLCAAKSTCLFVCIVMFYDGLHMKYNRRGKRISLKTTVSLTRISNRNHGQCIFPVSQPGPELSPLLTHPCIPALCEEMKHLNSFYACHWCFDMEKPMRRLFYFGRKPSVDSISWPLSPFSNNFSEIN